MLLNPVIGLTNINATIIKSIWSKIGAGSLLLIPILLLMKLPRASPTNAPKPSKKPIIIPFPILTIIGVSQIHSVIR